MPSRRQFLATLFVSVLVTGCGGSGGGGASTPAPEPTPDQKAIADDMKKQIDKQKAGRR